MIERAVSIIPTQTYLYQPKPSTKKKRQLVHEVHWFGEILRKLLPQLRLDEKEAQRVLMIEALELLNRRRDGEDPSLTQGRLAEIDADFRKLNSQKGPKSREIREQTYS